MVLKNVEDQLDQMNADHRDRLIFIGKMSGDPMSFIGEHLGLTRERIRQLAMRIENQFVEHCPDPTFLDGTEELTLHMASVNDVLSNNLLKLYGLVPRYVIKNGWSIGACYSAGFDQHINDIANNGHVLSKITPFGENTSDIIASYIMGGSNRSRGGGPMAHDGNILSFNNATWLWNIQSSTSLGLRVCKVLYITKDGQCDIDAMYKYTLDRTFKIEGMTIEMFSAILKRGNSVDAWPVKIEDGRIKLKHAIDDPLSRSEKIIVKLINGSRTGIATNQMIDDQLVKLGFSSATASSVIRQSPILNKVSRGHYSLID